MSESESLDRASSSNAATDSGKLESPLSAIYQYFEGIWKDFLAIPDIHEEVLDETVDNRIAMVQSLSGLDQGTLKRLGPVVSENTRYIYSGVWERSWAKALVTRPNLDGFLATVFFCFIPAILIIVGFSGDHLQIGGPPTLFATILCLAFCAGLIWVIARLFNFVSADRAVTLRDTLFSFSLVWLTGFTVHGTAEAASWLHRFHNASLPSVTLSFYQQIHWPTAFHDTCWIIACVMIFRVVYFLIKYAVRSYTMTRVSKSSGSVIYTAFIQDVMLRIAYKLNRSLKDKEEGNIASVPNDVRVELIDLIAMAADLIKGPWVRSLRTGYRSTDERTMREAFNISQAVLEWQSRAVFGGRHLETLRSDCIDAYVNAVDGDWQKIAEGVNVERKPRTATIRTIVRRVLAAIIPIPLVFMFAELMPHSLNSYKPVAFLVALSLACVEIMCLIDPEIIERIGAAVNIANSIRRPPK